MIRPRDMARPGLGRLALDALEAQERAAQVRLATLAALGSPAALEAQGRPLLAVTQEGRA